MKKKKFNSIYLINILITVAIFLGIILINRLSPFGNKMLSRSDAIPMFKPMLYNFIMKLKTGTLLNYTFNNGLGAATIFDYIYDLASPLNLVALLFKSADAMYLSVTLTKIIFAAVTMTFYANKKTDNKLAIIIATISYVFSSWFIAYNFYLPWLDIFLIFPLFQYSLEKIIDEQKYHMYIFCLSYMIITNLYLCFSVCIYTIIFFIIYKVLYKKENFKDKIIAFDYITLATIGSFLLSAFYLYAWFDSFLKIRIGFAKYATSPYTISFVDFIKSFYYSNISFIADMAGKSFPNIACPTIILVSFIYYLINKNEKIRDKIFVVISSLICIAVIFISKLDYVMNAFHQIRGLTYRYSFIISFLMICLFIRNSNNKEFNKKNIIISFLIILVGIIALYKKIYFELFVINLIFILSFFILAVLYKKNKSFNILIIIVFIVQVFYSTNLYFKLDFPKETPNIKEYNKNTVKYRINNKVENNSTNNTESINTYYNNKTTYIYSSLTYSPVINLYSMLGNITFSNTLAVMYDSNSIPSLLFNVKSEENDYYLEKIYAANKEISTTLLDEENIKNSMEYLVEDLTGIKNIYDKKVIQYEKKDGDNYLFNTNLDYCIVETKDSKGNIIYFPSFSRNFNSKNEESITIYKVNEKKLKEIYDYLNKNQIEYSYYQDNHIKGTINVDENQLIFTSIPYDKDWVVKIDGKLVKPIPVLDSLMAIKVAPGKHEIELEYKNHYLIPALISISTFIILITDYIIKKKKENNKKASQK